MISFYVVLKNAQAGAFLMVDSRISQKTRIFFAVVDHRLKTRVQTGAYL
jgi:hypothetical protein